MNDGHGKHCTKRAVDSELMGDDIIGLFLSREPPRDANDIMSDDEPKLRRSIIIHDPENIQELHVIGSGKHGIVVLAVIKGKVYSLKVVSISARVLQLVHTSRQIDTYAFHLVFGCWTDPVKLKLPSMEQ
jgi:hypothetical protein